MQRGVEKFGISDKRGRKRTSTDPYIPVAGLKEPAICQKCRALYRHKRWQLDPHLVEKLETSAEVQWVTCPGCQKVAEHYLEGVVTLRVITSYSIHYTKLYEIAASIHAHFQKEK